VIHQTRRGADLGVDECCIARPGFPEVGHALRQVLVDVIPVGRIVEAVQRTPPSRKAAPVQDARRKLAIGDKRCELRVQALERRSIALIVGRWICVTILVTA
jgi:hypothetical protein